MQSSGRGLGLKKIIVLKQGRTIFLLLVKSFFLKTSLYCYALIKMMTLQFLIRAYCFLILITNFSSFKMSFSINIFAWSLSTKCNLHLIGLYISFLAWFLLEKLRQIGTNCENLCFEAPIVLIFKKVDIALFFWLRSKYKSHVLLTKITSQPVSRSTIILKSNLREKK